MSEPQYISLNEWAEARYATPPHRNTLHRWAQNGMIVPAPFKRGNVYMVTTNARHIDEPIPGTRLVDRIRNGLSPAQQ